jgi:hypothetical protein
MQPRRFGGILVAQLRAKWSREYLRHAVAAIATLGRFE